jgi:tetratricopeptide (TPR) repeat protein
VGAALALARAGRGPEAAALLATLETPAVGKASGQFHLAEGLVHYYAADMDKAVASLTMATCPEAEGWMERAEQMREALLAAAQQGKRHDCDMAAMRAYSACLLADPANTAYSAQVYWRRALLQESHGRQEEAEADLSSCLGLAPGHPKAWARRAAIRWDAGRFGEAVEDFAMAHQVVLINALF